MSELEDLGFDNETVCPNCGHNCEGETECLNCGAILKADKDDLDGFHEEDEEG